MLVEYNSKVIFFNYPVSAVINFKHTPTIFPRSSFRVYEIMQTDVFVFFCDIKSFSIQGLICLQLTVLKSKNQCKITLVLHELIFYFVLR